MSRVLHLGPAYLGWGRGGLQGGGSGCDLILGSDFMVLLGCRGYLDLCGGSPRTFVVPTAWTDGNWFLWLMIMLVCLGLLFPGVRILLEGGLLYC